MTSFPIRLPQLDQSAISGFIESVAGFNFVSGLLVQYSAAQGYLGSHVIYNTGVQIAAGQKTFLDGLLTSQAIDPSGVVNLAQLTGYTGLASDSFVSTGSSGLFYRADNPSGFITGGQGHGGFITVTKVGNDSISVSGNSGNFADSIQFSGHKHLVPYSVSYYKDDLSAIGAATVEESASQKDWLLTGYSVGLANSGQGGFPLSGQIYVRDTNNNKMNINSFTVDSGIAYQVSGGLSFVVSGHSRLGYGLSGIMGGASGLCLNMFGNFSGNARI